MKQERKLIHDLASKVTASQLSLEYVLQRLETTNTLSADDRESLKQAFASLNEMTELLQSHRQLRQASTYELPKLATDARRSLLIVDDDEALRRATSDIFRNAGYVVYDVASGMEALEVVRKSEVDVLLTDLLMPGLDGQELATEIRKLQGKQPVLCLMSGDGDVLFRVREAVAAEGCVQKPFTRAGIVNEVYRALTRAK
jgi:CheY-like chemotaxis protein